MGYKRKTEDNTRLLRLYDITKNWYSTGVWYDKTAQRYKRYYASDGGRAKRLRQLANRKVRRTTMPLSGGRYRKIFDFWWELF